MSPEQYNKFIHHKDFRLWQSYFYLNLKNMNKEYVQQEANKIYNNIMKDIGEM